MSVYRKTKGFEKHTQSLDKKNTFLFFGIVLFFMLAGCEVRDNSVTRTPTNGEVSYTITPNPINTSIQRTPTPLPPHQTPTHSPTDATTFTPPSEISAEWDGYLALIVTHKNPKGILDQNLPYLCITKPDNSHLFCPLSNSVTYPTITWSPDGSFVLFSSLTETSKANVLHKLTLSTGQIEVMDPVYSSEQSHPVNMDNPTWSVEQNKILFNRSSMDKTEIHIMEPDGSTRYLFDGYFPIWFDQGQAIAYIRAEEDKKMNRLLNFGDLYRYNFENQEDTLLLPDKRANFLSSSPDGRRLAYTSFGVSEIIHIMNSDGSNPIEIKIKDAGFFSWDPNGEGLIIAKDCKIYRADLRGVMSNAFDLPEEYCYSYASLRPNQNLK